MFLASSRLISEGEVTAQVAPYVAGIITAYPAAMAAILATPGTMSARMVPRLGSFIRRRWLMVHTSGTPPNAQRSRCQPSSAHSDSAVSASSHSRDPGSTRRCSQLRSCRAKTSARRPRNPGIGTNGYLAQGRGDESFSKVLPQRASFAPSSRLLPLGDRYGVADGRVVLVRCSESQASPGPQDAGESDRAFQI